MSAKQGRLFDDLPMPEGMANLVKIAGSTRQLDPEQRHFNRLTDQVRRRREELRLWQERFDRLRQRVTSELLPLIEQMRVAQIGLVKRIDALLSDPAAAGRLTRRRRESLEAYLVHLINPLLEECDDPELKAIHARHSPFSQEEESELTRELAEALLSEMFGADALDGFAGGTLEDMVEHAYARHEQKQSARPATKRATAKAQALAEAQQEADHALREVYRKLASQLHPDRTTDPHEHQRRTELMQKVNTAYEKRDLLGLLTLQLECEQLDADRLAELPQARIQRFNHALREQIRTLDEEKKELIELIATGLQTSTHFITRNPPEMLDHVLDHRLEQARATLCTLQERIDALTEPQRHKTILDEIASEMEALEYETAMRLGIKMDWNEDGPPVTPKAPHPARSSPSKKRRKKKK
ncbi:MAG: J domain-containing protein [Thiobacillaceae bacterium]|nr:J domain-containing protein [Thiobacillaceae bacterium]